MLVLEDMLVLKGMPGQEGMLVRERRQVLEEGQGHMPVLHRRSRQAEELVHIHRQVGHKLGQVLHTVVWQEQERQCPGL